jgi:hypothetical protein
VKPGEGVIAAKQLEVIFQTFLPSRLTDRPPKKIRRALSDGEIQPFDERGVQFHGVFGVTQRLFQSRPTARYRSSLDPHDATVPTRLNDLTIETRWPKYAPDDFLVELEFVSDDQRDNFEIHSAGKVSKEGQRVLVALFLYNCEGQSRDQTSITTKTQAGCSLPPTIVHMSRRSGVRSLHFAIRILCLSLPTGLHYLVGRYVSPVFEEDR